SSAANSAAKTPPPNPLPEAERGSKTTPIPCCGKSVERSRCSRSAPPLRFGEGVGGRGSGNGSLQIPREEIERQVVALPCDSGIVAAALIAHEGGLPIELVPGEQEARPLQPGVD